MQGPKEGDVLAVPGGPYYWPQRGIVRELLPNGLLRVEWPDCGSITVEIRDRWTRVGSVWVPVKE